MGTAVNIPLDTYRKVIKGGTALADTLRKAQANALALADTLRVVPKIERQSTGKLKSERWLTDTLSQYQVTGTVSWDAGHVILGAESAGANGKIWDTNFDGTDYCITVKITHTGIFETTGSLTNIVCRLDTVNSKSYWVKLDDYGNKFDLIGWDGVNSNTLQTSDFTFIRGTQYIVKLSAFGNDIKAKIWPSDQVEPQSWTLAVTSTLSSHGMWQVYSADLVTHLDEVHICNSHNLTVNGMTQGQHKTRLGSANATPDGTGTAILNVEHEYIPATTLEILNASDDTVLDTLETNPGDIWGGDVYQYISTSILAQAYTDTKRAMQKLVSGAGDTKRRTQQQNQAQADTRRTLGNTAQALADTYRKSSKNAQATADSYRKTLANILATSDTVRKVQNTAGPIVDTFRKLRNTATAPADTYRKTQSNAQVQADAMRGLRKLTQALSDTYRKTLAQAVAQVDTLRDVIFVVTQIVRADTRRIVQITTGVTGDAFRKVKAQAQAQADTYRKALANVFATSDTARKVAAIAEALADIYRKAIVSVAVITDTTRMLQYIVTLAADNGRCEIRRSGFGWGKTDRSPRQQLHDCSIQYSTPQIC